MGHVFSFSSNFALILVHLPRPAENTSGKLLFSSILIFSASVVMHSTFWQNVLIGWSLRLNIWNQPDPNKFSAFFSRKTFNFFVIPFCDTRIIISTSNFILSPVTVLLAIFIIGLFNFVSLLYINQSQRLTEILPTYFVLWLLCIYERLSLVLAFCMSDSVFNYFSVSTLWALMSEFITILTFLLYDRDSPWPNVIFHRVSNRWVFFFCCN